MKPVQIELNVHHAPAGFSDRVAHSFTKFLRFFADTFFSGRYDHRAVVLETVAAVPGMVAGALVHLKSDDEAGHRDVNHGFANSLGRKPAVARSLETR